MNHIRKGILGLTLYNPDAKKWGQAHTQGSFVFAQWFLRNQKSKILEIELTENGNSFLIHLDQKALATEGKELITKLLMVL